MAELGTGNLVKKKANIFEGLPTGTEENPTQAAAGQTLQGMFSGEAFDPAKAQSRQAFQTAATNLRAQNAEAGAGFLGQGAANKAQQATNQSIFSGMAQNELGLATEEQAMKERALGAATDIAKAQTQADISREQIASQEQIAERQVGVQEAQLAESARQFDISTEDARKQFGETMKLNYDQLNTQQKQFLQSLGLDREKFEQAKIEFTQSLTQQGNIAERQAGIQEAQLAETARQFNISTADARSQFKETMKLNYDELTTQQHQFLASLGLDREKFEQAKIQFGQELAQQYTLAMEGIGVQKAQLTETARQFNISTQEASTQFATTMKYNYDQLSTQQQQFLQSLGLDREKFAQAKYEFNQTLAQQERLTMAQLNIQEKQIAEQSRQFNTEQEFRESELAANLSEAEKARVWQALQNEKAANNALTIARMQNDTEVWKTEQAAELTKAGWTQEAAQAKLNRDLQETLAAKSDTLQRWMLNEQITQQEADRVQQASQFADEMAWKERATQLGLSDAEAQRAWATNERLSTQAFQQTEASLDRQLDREVQMGNLSLQERSLAQQAMQFDTEQAFRESSFAKNMSEAAVTRMWQSSEAAKDRAHAANMAQLQTAITEKGWNFQALMGSVDALPPEQAAQVLSQVAISAGITHPKMNADGTPVIDPTTGNPIQVPGLRTTIPTDTKLSSLWVPGTQGTVTAEAAKKIITNADTYANEGSLVTDNYIEKVSPSAWDGKGHLLLTESMKEWVGENAGKLYKASNGRLYEVVGMTTGGVENVIFKDIQSGITLGYHRGVTFPGGIQ